MKKGFLSTIFLLVVFCLSIFTLGGPARDGTASAQNGTSCRTIFADVVALDQPFYFNRLGAINPNGMMYALARDVVVAPNLNPAIDPATNLPFVFEDVVAFAGLTIPEFEANPDAQAQGLTRADLAGQVALRADKRPRPLVLRLNEGDCLNINFTNLLDPIDFLFNLPAEFPIGQILGLGVPIPQQVADQPLTRVASIHIDGLYLEGDIGSDGSNVGQNAPSSLVAPGQSTTYIYHAEHEATHLMYSMGATMGADGAGGSRTYGLFGAVNVQKAGAEWYRSQLTRVEVDLAASAWIFNGANWISSLPQFDNLGNPLVRYAGDNPANQPILNYDATYPAGQFIVNPVNAVQQLVIGATVADGTFTLTFDGQTTGPIVYNATADTIDTALEALYAPAITNNFSVTAGNPGVFSIEFIGDLAASPQPLVTVDSTGLLVGGGETAIISSYDTTLTNNAVAGTFRFSSDGGATFGDPIAYDAPAGTVETALNALLGPNAVTVFSDQPQNWLITFNGPPATLTTNDSGLLISEGTTTITSDPLLLTTAISNNAVGGTFTLSDGTGSTGDLAYDEPVDTMQTALDTLLGPETATVSGTPQNWTITFSTAIVELTSNDAGLQIAAGGSTFANGSNISISNNASGGSFTLSDGTNSTAAIDYDAPASVVEAELNLLLAGAGTATVSGTAPSWTVRIDGSWVMLTANDSGLLTTGGTASVTQITAGIVPVNNPFLGTGKEGLPIINMLAPCTLPGCDPLVAYGEIVHTDLNAIITGPNRGRFDQPGVEPYTDNQAAGDRNAPYREFTVIFHDDQFAVQAFPGFYNDPVLGHTLAGVADAFPINYGSGGIGSEIIANRLGVGPMWDCAECKYEEFFLTSWTVGDPAVIVDVPANTDMDGDGQPDAGAKATKALFPDDPSNVHHSYLNDRVKFRNLHAGPKEHHIFHLHAHQWLFNPDDPQSNYLDGQAIGPGSGYTYEIAYGGSGNRNKTTGDSIFHCHFYPHFAQGMWEMWRVHDTFEQGTELIAPVDINGDGVIDNPVEAGRPAEGARALPDGEITAGTPIPGVVPIPTNAMAPMPDPAAKIVASDLNGDGTADSSQFDANGDGFADIFQLTGADLNNDGNGDPLTAPATNPGYPWYIPGLLGHRPPSPALDMTVDLNGDGVATANEGSDGGLPRHVVSSGPADFGIDSIDNYVSRLDFNKILHKASAIQIPEGGTLVEQVAMDFHAGTPIYDPITGDWVEGDPTYDSFFPDGAAATGTAGFQVNGLLPIAGAPYADPCRTDLDNFGNVTTIDQNETIKGANIEMPIVLNKVGWHFQQQRFEALWEDVVPTLTNARAPEPMIMRLNSTDCAEFWHTNLVPNVYQLDDYQVRTPTDIIGQHIHLVKFDVTSADGSANGWNYEDGTLSPDEVRERIDAFNHGGGFLQTDGVVRSTANTNPLEPTAHPFFGATGPNGQNWLGARTTVQRWYADPLLERSWDGGVGTVFTHDHYGPSTHQQVGLYSTLLIEPEGSTWRHNETGVQLGTRHDGGPTTWQAIIEVPQALWTDLDNNDLTGVPCDADNDPTTGTNGNEEPGCDDPTHREFYFEFADFQHAYEANNGGLITQPNEQIPALRQTPGGQPLWPEVVIPSYADFDGAINPSFRLPPVNPEDIYVHPNWCPGTFLPDGTPNPLGPIPRPCPEAISADDPGTYALNFRNEPIGLRVFDGVVGQDGPGGVEGGQAPGLAGDLAFAYQSRTDRAIAELNVQPETNGISPYPPLTSDVRPGDPWTPILRVYMGDKVRIRVQVGAHEEEHNFTIPGLKWRKEPNSPNSGWRNSEFFGIDEYFNLDVPIIPDTQKTGGEVDYIYTVGAELEGMWNGVWGILRSYTSERKDLYELRNNDIANGGYDFTNNSDANPDNDFDGMCPTTANIVTFDVTAVRALDVLDHNQGLVYNDRITTLRALPGGIAGEGPLIDPTATIYVLNQDLVYDGAGNPMGLQPNVPVEPLILRVNAGDCVLVNLTNALPSDLSTTEMPGWNSMVPTIQKDENLPEPGVGGILTFNANDITPSSYVGLTPQLLAFDPKTEGGFSTGLTTGKLVPPGGTDTYRWYAGHVTVANGGVVRNKTRFTLTASPVEFGAAGLMAADRIKGTENGMVGAIIVEPQDSCWIADPGTRAQATVWKGATNAAGDSMVGECLSTPIGSVDAFRDFVTIMQNDINLRYGGTVEVLGAVDPVTGEPTLIETINCGDPVQMPRMECAVPNIAAEGPLGPTEESQDSGQKAINYQSDPPWFRLGVVPDFFQIIHRDTNLKDLIPNVYSNYLDIGAGPVGDPQTQVFNASPNGPQYGRMRVLMPGGHARGVAYTVHGHQWQSQPYINNSSEIGDRSTTGISSEYYGAQEGINPTGHWDFVVDLGGPSNVQGDYLWRDQAGFGSFMGLWGLLRFNQTAPVAVDIVRSIPKYVLVPGTTDIYSPGSVELDLLALAFDLDGFDPANATVVITQPNFGTLSNPVAGVVTYSYAPLAGNWPCPASPLVCPAIFTYTITDAQGNMSKPGTVTINVTNRAPLANNDTVQITEENVAVNVPVPVLNNDTDAEGDLARTPLTVALVDSPLDQDGQLAGTVRLNADNTIQYVNDNIAFRGVARFHYTVEDESGAVSNQGVVRMAIRVDSIVITSAQFQEVNGKWTIAGTCSIPGNTITIYTGSTIEPNTRGEVVGIVSCALDRTFLFSSTSNAPTPLRDQLNYVSAESSGLGFYEGFPLRFAGQNNPPVANPDAYTTNEDTELVNATPGLLGNGILANDIDADFDNLTAVLVSGPVNGTLVLNPNGSFRYTPKANFNGSDSFAYQANDGQALSNVVMVTITVNPVNDVPTAVNDTYVTARGEVLNVVAPGVLGSWPNADFDVEGNAFTLDTTPVSGPAAGNSLVLIVDGSFTYTPGPGFSGTDTFQYRICEDLSISATCGTGTVTINVGVNTAPVAVDDTAVADQTTATLTTPATGNVLANDSDADNIPPTAPNAGLTAVLVTGPANGSLQFNPNGSFTYTPILNFVGTDRFTYQATDGVDLSNVATVTITVKDRVTVTAAQYQGRQGRWAIQGTVSNVTSSIRVYLNSVAPENLIGTANVDPISGAWSLNTRTGPDPRTNSIPNDTVIAVSSFGGLSAPFQVTIR